MKTEITFINDYPGDKARCVSARVAAANVICAGLPRAVETFLMEPNKLNGTAAKVTVDPDALLAMMPAALKWAKEFGTLIITAA